MASSVDIPVLDLSAPSAPQDILRAASTYGFVFVQNNEQGIPVQDVQAMFDTSRKFFKSPVSVKEECSINSGKSEKNRGWVSMGTEKLDPAKHNRGDFKEAFNFGEFVGEKAQQPLPKPLADEEARIGRFMGQCHALCNRILDQFAKALDIPVEEGGAQWFSQRHDRASGPSGSILRLLYYPALPPDSGYDPQLDIRAGAHSDYGSVTLLFQLPGQPGLEILTADGTWASVPINPTNLPTLPILVNIGDLLSYWTNGLLKSTVHRVIMPPGESADRYSIAYFCHPLDDAKLVPVPSAAVADRVNAGKVGYGGGAEMAEEDAKKGMVLTAKDHLNRRLAATYGLKA